MKKIILITIMLSIVILASSLVLGQCPSDMKAYWRLEGNANDLLGTNSGLAHGTATSNLALNRPVIASSHRDQSSPHYAVDGSTSHSTFTGSGTWIPNDNEVPGSNGYWIRIDLGSVRLINSFRMFKTSFSGRSPTSYTVDVSTDASTWIVVKSITGEGGVGSWSTHTFSSIYARYVRFRNVVAPSYPPAIAEIQIYGNNNIPSATGKLGNSLNFNGVNNFIEVPVTNSLRPTSQITISSWVYPTGNTGVRQDILFGSPGYFLGINANDKVTSYINNGAWIQAEQSEGAITYNQWNHIAMTYDGSRLKTYLNGQVVRDVSVTGSISIPTAIVMGASTNKNSEFFNGRIDEVAVYNRTLSEGEMWSLYYGSNYKNTNYCNIKPIVTTFESTNVNEFEDLTQAKNFTLVKQDAQVRWLNPVNVVGENLDSNVNLGSNYISLNVNNLDNTLNSEANITFMVDGCYSPRIYYVDSGFYDNLNDIKTNGIICPENICSEMRCDGNTLTFTAAHFDGFGGEGDPVGDPVIPEFNLMGIILVIIIASTGLYFVSRRN